MSTCEKCGGTGSYRNEDFILKWCNCKNTSPQPKEEAEGNLMSNSINLRCGDVIEVYDEVNKSWAKEYFHHAFEGAVYTCRWADFKTSIQGFNQWRWPETQAKEEAKGFKEWFVNTWKPADIFSTLCPIDRVVFAAEAAWNHQQARIDELEAEKKTALIEWGEFAAQSDLKIMTLERRVYELKTVLQKHHTHSMESLVVYFEQDGKPIDISTDLGESYSDSELCEKTIEAISLLPLTAARETPPTQWVIGDMSSMPSMVTEWVSVKWADDLPQDKRDKIHDAIYKIMKGIKEVKAREPIKLTLRTPESRAEYWENKYWELKFQQRSDEG